MIHECVYNYVSNLEITGILTVPTDKRNIYLVFSWVFCVYHSCHFSFDYYIVLSFNLRVSEVPLYLVDIFKLFLRTRYLFITQVQHLMLNSGTALNISWACYHLKKPEIQYQNKFTLKSRNCITFVIIYITTYFTYLKSHYWYATTWKLFDLKIWLKYL